MTILVLDLEYPQIAVRALEMAFRDHTNGDARTIYRSIADQIMAQLKPARIPEPGPWGVVEAGLKTYPTEPVVTYKWVRHDRYWVSKSFPTAAEWADLIDPTLIRDGVA